MKPKHSGRSTDDPATDRIVDAFQAMMQRQMRHHAIEFNEIDVTMAQAKVLYMLVAAGELQMSALAGRLGVTSSTATGLVDRLVELGLAVRHEDAGDRRQVVIRATPQAQTVLERFRELNARRDAPSPGLHRPRRPAGHRARHRPDARCHGSRGRRVRPSRLDDVTHHPTRGEHP